MKTRAIAVLTCLPWRIPALIWAFLLVAVPATAQTLRIYHIDLEQAEATLFVSPSGKTLLVDSGKNGHGPRIKAVMDEAGVTTIDFFVNTHYHEDHYGGIDDLVNLGVTVGKAYDRGDKDELSSAKKKEKTFKDYQTAVGNQAEQLSEEGRYLKEEIVDATGFALTTTCEASERTRKSKRGAGEGHRRGDRRDCPCGPRTGVERWQWRRGGPFGEGD